MDDIKDEVEVEDYNEESQFCSECTEDFWLKTKIRKHGTKKSCSVCENEAEYVISFDTLADWLEKIWREWFHVGNEQPVILHDSDKIHYEQLGDEPHFLISDLIKCLNDEERVVNSLLELLGRGDHYEIMQGGEALFYDYQLYQQRKLSKSLVNRRWNSFVMDLKHHTRYFNVRAIEFFNMLFEDLRTVHVPSAALSFSPQPHDENKPVVQFYEPGSLVIYRARKAESQKIQVKIISAPESELNNPPDRLAAEGRMNPKGISYFYGAEDRQTCLAELRLSLSEKAISAEFEVITPVQMLDLTLLSDGRHERTESLFDDKYEEKQIHRQLLRQLHWLIAQPVSDGDGFEYLPTQAMAEYLARRTSPRIDGIIFESVQLKGGRNIVFFPHVLNKDNHSALDFMSATSAIRMKPNTLLFHETKQIDYSFKDRKIVDGKIEGLHDDYDFIHDNGDF